MFVLFHCRHFLQIVPFVPDKFLNYNPSITFYPVLMFKKNNVTLDEVKVI